MNPIHTALITANSVRTIVDSAIWQFNELQNRLHRFVLSEESEENSIALANTVKVAETVYANLVEDLSALLKVKKEVCIVVHPIPEYPDLKVGSVLINNVGWIEVNETWIPLDYIVNVEMIDKNLITRLG